MDGRYITLFHYTEGLVDLTVLKDKKRGCWIITCYPLFDWIELDADNDGEAVKEGINIVKKYSRRLATYIESVTARAERKFIN